MKRLEAIRIIDAVFKDCPLVMTCGSPARELASIERRDSHLYLLDAMGLAAPVGLGLALACSGPVAAVEGDGSFFMGLSVLASLGYHCPSNLTIVVIDNHEHASAARVPTQAVRIDIAALARAAGLKTADVHANDALRSALCVARDSEETVVIVARVEGGNASQIPLLLEDPVAIANRFRGFLCSRRRTNLAPPP